MFKAMVAALVERPEEINAGGALDNHHEEESSQFVPMDQPHLPLVKADPNAFYSDTAFFAKPPTRVRFGRTTLQGLRSHRTAINYSVSQRGDA